MKHRYFIYLSYDGTQYHGWQIQPNGESIQQVLMDALSLLLRQDIAIVGAGRTDAGVHAKTMIAHFDFDGAIDESHLVSKLNKVLPHDIAVSRLVEVHSDAHARFDATSRTYEYYISTRKDPFSRNYAYQLYYTVDIEKMNEACKILFEYADFTSFSKLHSDTKTNICTIHQAKWVKKGDDGAVFVIQANRFLRNMVRAIVGTLLEVGRGKMTLETFRTIIEKQDRSVAGMSVPGHALFLKDVSYPASIFLV